MANIIDSRELIREKFLKKTRLTTMTEYIPEINFLNEQEHPDDIREHVHDTSYAYLADDPLSREHTFDKQDNRSIFLCMYRTHNELVNPYITYSLISENNMLVFPNIKPSYNEVGITEPNIIDTNSSIDDEDADETFIQPSDNLTQDDENINDTLRTNDEPTTENMPENDDFLFVQGSRYINNISVNNNQISHDCYKGFIKTDDAIYTFFNISDIELTDDFNAKHKNCILDEIINIKHVNGIQIEPTITNLFRTENEITYIYDKQHSPIHYPIRVFLCENINGEYMNSKYADDKEIVSLIEEKIDHPVVGNGYLFTHNMIDTSFVKTTKRFALFHSDAVYVLHEPFIQSEYEVITDNACVCFLSDGTEYWSVKNIDLFSEI